MGSSNKKQGFLSLQRYADIEGIYFKESFAPVARLEAIIMLLAFSSHKNIKVYKMDVKPMFFNRDLEEEVYIENPKWLMLTRDDGFVCKLKKALHWQKHASRAWYPRQDQYLQKQVFKKGIVDNNPYIKSQDDRLLIVVVYVDNIIFCSDLEWLGHQFTNCMKIDFEMSMIGEFFFFLVLNFLNKKSAIYLPIQISTRNFEEI